MIQKSLIIELSLNSNKDAAREVAEAVMFRANPHQSQLVEDRLKAFNPKDPKDFPIDVEHMTIYFQQLILAIGEFWNNTWDSQYQTVLKPHELRNLYLPTIYGVILSSVGNMKKGNYEYRIKAKVDEKPDRDFIIPFSAKLESLRDIVRGDIGQVGNRAAQPQEAVMLSLLGQVASDNRSAELLIRDGVTVDKALAGLAALVGVSLVQEAYNILYTGVDEVNFRQLTDTLVDKGLVALKTGNAQPDA